MAAVLGGDGVDVILEVGAIGRAHLDEPRLALGHDLGQAEGTADLDKLAARHDDLLLRRQGRQHQHRRARVVVHHRCGFRPGQLRKDGLHQLVPFDALAGLPADCQRAVALELRLDRVHDAPREDGPAQPGVQDNAGGVDGAAQARAARLRQQLARPGQQGGGADLLRPAAVPLIGQRLPPRGGGRAPQALGHQPQRMRLEPHRDRLALQQLRHRRDALEQFLFQFWRHNLTIVKHGSARLSMIFGRRIRFGRPRSGTGG